MRCIQLASYRCRLFLLMLLLVTALSVGCQTGGRRPLASTTSNYEPVPEASPVNATQPEVVQVAFDEPIVRQAEPVEGIVAPEPLQLQPALSLPDSDGASTVAAESLSLEQLEASALAGHPELRQARARVNSRRGRYVQAGLPFNPVLQYQSEEIGNEGASGLHSLRVNQQFVTANKLGIAQQVQAYEVQKQQAQLRAAELRVLTRIRIAFAAAAVSQRRAELTDQIVELAERSLRSVQSLVDAKEASNVALLQAKVELDQARVNAENAVTQLQATRRALAAAVGMPELPPSDLAVDREEVLGEAPWEVLMSELEASSPELAAAGSELERARWALQLACAQVTPNITGQVGVGVDTATDDTYAIVGVSIPLPIRNRNQGNIQTARADIAAASAAIDQTRLSLDGRLADAVGRYQTARQRYEQLEKRIVPNAEETYKLSQQAFAAGDSDFLQLLTVQRTLFTTRLSVLDAFGQAKQALAEIEGLLVTLQP
ncbi:TolC family protein [uncultured Rubinisphaera sp.]|uniref:TolC family protein n=1 Tax=uncultured Rubinisphaera sp. TaxID=1678686 RepID=UPI0030D86877